jgi:hypothetical protein
MVEDCQERMKLCHEERTGVHEIAKNVHHSLVVLREKHFPVKVGGELCDAETNLNKLLHGDVP